jgi:hypothetical protein
MEEYGRQLAALGVDLGKVVIEEKTRKYTATYYEGALDLLKSYRA